MTNFSIVTIVLNDLQGLKKTRESIENQVYDNWYHIIVDGGSTDGTKEFLESLPRMNTIYLSEVDNGIYSAMNKAWKLAPKNSYIFFLNARDVFATKYSLGHANEIFEKFPFANWGCTTHEEILDTGEGWVCKLVSPLSIPNQLYAFGYRSHQAVVMRASFIEKLEGFNENFSIAADWDLIVRALILEKPIQWVEPLAIFEIGGESSRRILEAHKELKDLRKIYLLRGPLDFFLDDIWSAIYLKQIGFNNYLTWVVNLLSIGANMNVLSRFKKLFLIIPRFWNIHFGLGRGVRKLKIKYMKTSRSRLHISFYEKLTFHLFKKLKIQSYIPPKDLSNK